MLCVRERHNSAVCCVFGKDTTVLYAVCCGETQQCCMLCVVERHNSAVCCVLWRDTTVLYAVCFGDETGLHLQVNAWLNIKKENLKQTDI